MTKLMITLVLAFLLTACSGNGGGGSVAPGEAAEPDQEGPAAIAQRVVADATGIRSEQVIIVSVEAVEFPDSSLGCPQPDMGYLQVITPGHKVIAKVADPEQQYDVRIARGQGFICTAKDRR